MPRLRHPPFELDITDPSGQMPPEWQRFLIDAQDAIDVGSAPSDAAFLIATANSDLSAARNLGLLASGYLKIAVALGIAAISSSATLAAADLVGILPALNAAALLALNATQLTSGTVPDARFPATLPAASGINLTALVGGNVTFARVAKATADSPYTMSASDVFVDVNATAGVATVKLPAAPVTGRLYGVLKSDASVNVVTLDGNGHTVNGAATLALTAAQYASKLVRYTGTEFLVVAST